MTGLTIRTPALLGRTTFDQIFDQFFNDPLPAIRSSTGGYPLTDIYTDESGNQIIEIALAGFKKSDISIETKQNTIEIKCDKPSIESGPKGHRRIARRAFSRRFVDYHNQLNFTETTAKFEDGMLLIEIPLRQEQRAITVEIQ